ncbi:MAG: tripartite tricarboxylate transporter substrate-binding protein [Hyphomicrobiaceae bacterium]|nr:tripartite tricarboxylate transporter substrate-binding protein [Hyphomicrobiaceae bacterium]
MKLVTRRTAIATVAAGVFAPALVRAQGTYPAGQTLKIIVPYPAGGATDIVGRAVADALAELWKVTVVVENVSGAGANLGMDRAAKGPTDGTVMFVVPPNISTNQFLYAKLAYDPEKDLMPLAQVSRFCNLLTLKKALGAELKTVKDFIDYAKKNAGKLNYASSGVGTTIHLSAELFKRMTGVEMTHVAYRGSAPAVQDLVGGQVDVMFDNLPSIYPQVKGGTVHGLAVTQATKSRFAPEFPTVAETVPGYDVQSWFGIGVRSGVSSEIAAIIERDVIAVCKTEPVQARLAKAGMDTVGSTKAEFDAWINTERKRWGDLIVNLNIKAQ